MISSVDDLIVSVGSDAGMIAAMAGLWVLIRKSMRGMADRDVGDIVARKVAEALAVNGETPRQIITGLREHSAGHAQAIVDLRGDVDGLSRRLGELREDFIRHSERQQ